MSVSILFSSFPSFGFSGSRSVPVSVVGTSLSASVAFAVSCVPEGASVSVGCAGGVDAAVRLAFPLASVFRAAEYPARNFAASLALRSIACVRSVASAGGLWVSFPSVACPSVVRPCASPFSVGGRSGTWASAALAAFLGMPVLVCIPAGALFGCPSWGSWSFVGCAPSSGGVAGGSFFLLRPPGTALF